MQTCIDTCHDCRVSRLSMAMTHCLEMGGEHPDPKHMTLMLDCAEICPTTLNLIARSSDHHDHLCRECAEICSACAASCERLEGMEECVQACHRGAESCDRIAARSAPAGGGRPASRSRSFVPELLITAARQPAAASHR